MIYIKEKKIKDKKNLDLQMKIIITYGAFVMVCVISIVRFDEVAGGGGPTRREKLASVGSVVVGFRWLRSYGGGEVSLVVWFGVPVVERFSGGDFRGGRIVLEMRDTWGR